MPGADLRHQVLGILQEAAEVLGFEPSVHFDGPVDSAVSTTVAGQVSAVLREALTNIGRHASASSARVELAPAMGTSSGAWQGNQAGPLPPATVGEVMSSPPLTAHPETDAADMHAEVAHSTSQRA